jgi:hypothetical protein
VVAASRRGSPPAAPGRTLAGFDRLALDSREGHVLKMDLLDELGRRVGRACGGEMAGQERGEDGGQVRGQARSQVRNQVRSDVSFRFDLVVAGTRALAYGAQVEVRSGAPLSPPARACLEEAVADGIELRTEQPRYPAFSGTATLLLGI